jgi:hypothetical protein
MFQKLYRHLEQITENTRQQQINSEQAGLWAEKLSSQMVELNNSIRSLDKQRSRRNLQAAAFFLAGMGLVVLGILATYTLHLSKAADQARDRSVASLVAYGLVNSRCRAVNDKALNLEARTARLDSLVQDQEQTIEELKKLNASSIRTIYYLERRLNHQEELQRSQVLAK